MQVGAMLERVALGLGNFDELLKFTGHQHRDCGCKLNVGFAAHIGKQEALSTRGNGERRHRWNAATLSFPTFSGFPEFLWGKTYLH